MPKAVTAKALLVYNHNNDFIQTCVKTSIVYYY